MNSSKLIKQSGELRFETERGNWYKVGLVTEDGFPLGWNVSSSTGIDHHANGLLHSNFEKAYKAMKSAIENEEK